MQVTETGVAGTPADPVATSDAVPAAAPEAASPSKIERWVLVAIILSLDSFLHLITTHIGGSWDQESSPVSQFAWTSLYFWAVVGLIRERERALFLVQRSGPILAVIALIVLSSLWSTFPDLTAKRAFGLFGTSLIGFYVVCRFRLAVFLECFVIATGIAAGLSIFAILFLHRIGVMQEEYAGAWQGIYGHKNILAAAMVFGIINALLLALASVGRRRWAYIGLIALFAGLLVGSRSATSLLITATMVGIITLTLLARSRRFAGATGIAVLLVLAVVAIAIPALGIDMQAVFDLLGRDSTLTGRTDIWPYAIQAIGDRPLLGWGYKAFWLDNGPVQQYITSDWLPFHAHNGFLELSLDIGLLGTGTFIIAWFLGVWRGLLMVLRGTDAISLWPLMTSICFVLSNITEASIASYNTFQWVFYLAAFLYAIAPAKPKPVAASGYGTVERPSSTT